MRVHIEAYGCTLNQGEANIMAEALREGGHVTVDDEGSADAHLLVTCTVIDATERRMISRMKALSESGKKLIVAGCMASAQRAMVAEIAPTAELVPPGDLLRVTSILGREGPILREEQSPIPPPLKSSCAVVPIANGCLGRCTYCITRLARGALRSREPKEIVGRVKRYVAAGYREIRLTAQDSAAYGRDVGLTLAALIGEVAGVPGDFRIRIGMANPQTCLPILDELVAAYSSPKVYKFLHLPVQSGSDEVLQAMGRDYTVGDFRRVVLAFRDAYRDISLSTDVIVGFPGETETQFASSMGLLAEVRPDIVNVTRFSPRPSTPAAAMPNQVVGWRAKERSRAMTAMRFRISRELNASYEGRVVEAMTVERGKGDTTLARTSNYKQVVLEGRLPLGRAVRAKVVKGRDVDLLAESAG